MKKTLIFLFSLLLAAAGGADAYAQPTLAVLVVGMETDAKSNDFARRLGNELARNGDFVLVPSNNPALAIMLATLRLKHAQGEKVDTSGAGGVSLASWGRANNIDFVQLVVVDTVFKSAGGAVLERVAHLVDCSSGKLSGRGTYRTVFAKDLDLVLGRGLKMARVSGGVFQMGCLSNRDGDCQPSETPHWVKVNDFGVGVHPVTQRLWKAVMGDLPDGLTADLVGDDKPVVNVTYTDITKVDGFLARLNAMLGKRYRLPTEAEWEYAARACSAGSCDRFAFSGSSVIADVAWYLDNRPAESPQPVAGKAPNALGIYDMTGNVYEWCSDGYSLYYGATATELQSSTQSVPIANPAGTTLAQTRVARGGSWSSSESSCRVAYRRSMAPSTSVDNCGFRLATP